MSITREEPIVQVSSFREDFETFYRRELRSVTGLAYVLSGSPSGADDLAQDAFLDAYRNWDKISAYDSPEAWVRRVVSNRSVSRIRRRTAEARALVRLRGSSFTVPELSPDVLATWAAVRKLPERQAQVVALRYYDGAPVSDIAHILDCTESTVKTHLERARQTLSKLLDEGDSK